jgi:hypothetical protein
MTLEKEFSYELMNEKNIEKPRMQYVGNCWAIALASLIGDKFSISNNTKPIYPSSIWITSMHQDICNKEDEKNIYKKDFCVNFGIGDGFDSFYAANFMKNNNLDYYTKLGTCYPELGVIEKKAKEFGLIEKNLDEVGGTENLNFLEINYLGKTEPDCCLINQKYDEILKYYNCIFSLQTIENLIKLRIKDVIKFKSTIKDKIDYTDKDIKTQQRLLKNFIKCNGPVLANIIATKEYLNSLKNEEVFEQKIPVDFDLDHSIIILGWTTIKEKEYWYIRDSNKFGKVKPVAFSRFDNKDCWIGPDLVWVNSEIFTVNVEKIDESYLSIFK